MEWHRLDESAISDLAVRVAGILEPGDVVVLSGEVGAGKTTFVRSAAPALGVQERVTSPTYQLARSYRGKIAGERVAVSHLDLYRLEELDARDVLELDDYLDPSAITFIEWAEPALDLLTHPTTVHLSHETITTRTLELSGPAAQRLSEC